MEPKDWIAAASLAVSLGIFLYTRVMLSRGAQQKDIDNHSKAISDLKVVVAELKSQVSSLPTKDAFHQLELVVTKVESNQRVFDAELKPIALAVLRIEKFLIESVTPKSTRK